MGHPPDEPNNLFETRGGGVLPDVGIHKTRARRQTLNELNLTTDQKQRIENAKTPEEKAAIILEATGVGSELSEQELDAISGGVNGHRVNIPPTHAEIDQCWDIVQGIMDTYGQDVAVTAAYDLNLIKTEGTPGNNYFTGHHTIPECRAWMHRQLDGKNDYYSSTYGVN